MYKNSNGPNSSNKQIVGPKYTQKNTFFTNNAKQLKGDKTSNMGPLLSVNTELPKDQKVHYDDRTIKLFIINGLNSTVSSLKLKIDTKIKKNNFNNLKEFLFESIKPTLNYYHPNLEIYINDYIDKRKEMINMLLVSVIDS